MNDGRRPTATDDLEARLLDLAGTLEFPSTPNLAAAVGARLRATASVREARPRVLPDWRSLRRSLLLAAALVLLVVGTALSVRFGLELLSIEFRPLPTQPPASTSARPSAPLGAGLRLGRALPLDEADAAAAFDILVPADLGPPEDVYLRDSGLRGQVAFIYAPRDGLPASPLLDGAGLLVTQNQGRPDPGLARKIADSSRATVERVDVDGSPGLWISGEPHLFWYLDTDGVVIEESRRIVGDTLAWERDGVLYRIEGAIPLSRALEIARSMR